jgi:hypothetical protein
MLAHIQQPRRANAARAVCWLAFWIALAHGLEARCDVRHAFKLQSGAAAPHIPPGHLAAGQPLLKMSSASRSLDRLPTIIPRIMKKIRAMTPIIMSGPNTQCIGAE